MTFECVENPRGTELKIDGQAFIFAPLTLGAIETFLPALQNFKPTDISLVIDVAYKSLRRNYPSITRDDVADMIYMDQLNEVMEAVMNTSGLNNKSESGESSGE